MNAAATTSGLIALTCYLISAALLIRGLGGQNTTNRTAVLSLGGTGLLFHAISVYILIFTASGLQLGVISIASLFAWVMVATGNLSSLYRRNEALLAPAYPLACIAIAVSLLYTDNLAPKTRLEPGVTAHIILSIMAYSAIALAFSQAVLIFAQNYQLKKRHINKILHLLPPLQTMEDSLFDLIAIGFALLTAAILTGFAFMDDLLSQHLVHKTVLTIASWLVFGLLLIGRQRWGWRGMVAVKWTLAGFTLLIIGYFGSRIALEFIFNKH